MDKDRTELQEKIESLLKKWKGDCFDCCDVEQSLRLQSTLETGLTKGGLGKDRIRSALTKIAKKEGFHTDRVGNRRYYWYEEINKESSQDGTRIEG